MRTPRTIKAISRNPSARTIVSWIGANYIRIVDKTTSWKRHNLNSPEVLLDKNQPYIASFWHGRLMMMGSNWKSKLKFYMLISGHPDGKFIAKTIQRLGFNSLEISTKKGGTEALRIMVKLLKTGNCIGITPDGPRGPRMRAGMGVITLAKLTGAPIFPTTYSTTRRTVLNSWDRFIVARSFGNGIFLWGAPIWVPKNANYEEMERLRKELENSLNSLSKQADIECGQSIIEPVVIEKPSNNEETHT